MNNIQTMPAEQKDNKGFSLVELIIVIAIMAILVGIVGTQVIPYLNTSREAKDQQVLSSYCTAAVSAYTQNAEKVTGTSVTLTVYPATAVSTTPEKELTASIKELTYASCPSSFSSSEGQKIKDIKVVYDLSNSKVTVTGLDSSGNAVAIDPVVSQL